MQELYAWLSRHQDEAEPAGYWPDSLPVSGKSCRGSSPAA